MPGYSVPIKERMLFSSCKNTLISYLETSMGLRFDKKVQVFNIKHQGFNTKPYINYPETNECYFLK